MTDYFTKRTPAEVDEEDEDFSEEDESALPTPLTQLPVTGESNIPADPPSERKLLDLNLDLLLSWAVNSKSSSDFNFKCKHLLSI